MPEGLSLGRIQAGLAQTTQELTVAAANLNFDFTLVKLEAPPEYQTIGNFLAPSRLHEAETGPLHITARKLGALFDGVCPETPILIKAYGTRASEISKEVSEADLEANPGQGGNWIRNEYGGIDATSIWAAATSSKAALPIHLLACIIARMWKHTEAISIWVEIITERKREIRSKFEEGKSTLIALASATQQEITRNHISNWDASARAWLQTADKARKTQITQFLLIVKNLSMAVHQNDVSLYSNVVNVWTSALIAAEGLVSGKPHAVQNGPVLLGLSAWHIFPDMLVFNGPTGNMQIPMNDPLVKPGGVLSLGISDSARQEEQGVYWSLSLSHYKYYGEAVRQTRRLDVAGSRLTLNELFLVCIGSLLRCWKIPKKDIMKSIKTLEKVVTTVPSENLKNLEDDWRHTISRPLQEYAAGEKEAQLAISFGRRRPGFLPTPLTAERKSLFGLLQLPNLLFLLKDPNKKIELLRRLATRVHGLDNTNSIILCFDNSSISGHQYASVFPNATGNPLIRTPHGSKYHRWVQIPKHLQMIYEDAIKLAKDEYDRAIQGGGNSSKGFESEERVEKEALQKQTNLVQHEMARYHDFEDSAQANLRGGSGDTEIITISDSDSDMPDSQFYLHDEDYNASNDLSDQGNNSDYNRSISRSMSKSDHTESGDVRKGNNDKDRDGDAVEYEVDFENFEINTTSDRLLAKKQREEKALNDRRIAASQELSIKKEVARKKYAEICAEYLTERERELKTETIEILKQVGRPNGAVWLWDHDKAYDVVTFMGDKEDSFACFSSQKGEIGFLQFESLNEHAMLYVKGKKATSDIQALNITIDDILWCFEHDLVDSVRLKMLVAQDSGMSFMKVLAVIGEIYREPTAGGATISCSIVDETFDPPIFSKVLGKDDWPDAHLHLSINETTAIALIGYFETGHNVIDVMKGGYNIIGLSGGDSIFVRTAVGTLNSSRAIRVSHLSFSYRRTNGT